jgi:hypothetical protein
VPGNSVDFACPQNVDHGDIGDAWRIQSVLQIVGTETGGARRKSQSRLKPRITAINREMIGPG